jgi:hypothetical protein
MAAVAGVVADVTAAQGSPAADKYVVVASVPRSSPYYDVAQFLAEHRKAAVVDFAGDFDSLRTALQQVSPKYVAVVAEPSGLDCNFAARFFDMSTKLDEDPEVDVCYGFITGETAGDAKRLVENTIFQEKLGGSTNAKFAGIGQEFDGQQQCWKFIENCAADFKENGYEAIAIHTNDDDSSWPQKKAQMLKKVNGCGVLFLSGHGEGDWSGLCYGRDFATVDLRGAIVMNGTCYGVVTGPRLLDTPGDILKSAPIKPSESLCLNIVKAGAAGYFGSTYSSALMNVYPAFAWYLQAQPGKSLGEAQQAFYNRRIADLGGKSFQIPQVTAGGKQPFEIVKDEKESLVVSAAYSILVGDPAYVPYPKGIWAIGTQQAASSEKEARVKAELSRSAWVDYSGKTEIKILTKPVKTGELTLKFTANVDPTDRTGGGGCSYTGRIGRLTGLEFWCMPLGCQRLRIIVYDDDMTGVLWDLDGSVLQQEGAWNRVVLSMDTGHMFSDGSDAKIGNVVQLHFTSGDAESYLQGGSYSWYINDLQFVK